MSIITEKNYNKSGKQYRVMVERYENTQQMVNDLKTRSITDRSFDDKTKGSFGAWEGVNSYNECLEYLENGYQPSVDKLKDSVKPVVKGESKRISFKNNVAGANPIVPLALIGVPNCMQDVYIKPIKAKVIDVYYDVACAWNIESRDIIKAGQMLLETILRLEQQGYKFNLYAVQSYASSDDCDMLCIKVKSSNQPIDLKRMSYTLTHTSFFRVLGFDWYSRTPKGKYRDAYGHNIASDFDYDGKRTSEFAQQIFGKNSIYLSAMIMNKKFKNSKDQYINQMINVK